MSEPVQPSASAPAPAAPAPQIIYVQAPPPAAPAGSAFASAAGEGLALGGRLHAVASAVVGVIIMLVMLVFGVVGLRRASRYSASAPMTVTAVMSCTPAAPPPGSNGGSPGFHCALAVSFTPAAATAAVAATVTVTRPAPAHVGDVVTMRYDPANPADVAQSVVPSGLCWGLIGGGVLLGGIGVGLAYLTFKSKRFAEFEGAASLMGMMQPGGGRPML